jgi:subtilisin family serine protease
MSRFVVHVLWIAIILLGGLCPRSFAAAERSGTGSGIEYQITVEFSDANELAIARMLGLSDAQVWKKAYRVSPELYERLSYAGIDCKLVGGVSEVVIEPAVSPMLKVVGTETTSTGETFLDSGDVYESIPDGTGEVLYLYMTATEAPEWATVTGVEYSTLIDEVGGVTCWDFMLSLFHGPPGEDYIFWMNFGDLMTGTDDNFDSDPENDNDIDIQDWYTESFNGESANGDWGISCYDMIWGDPGWVQYLRIRIYWEAGDPPDPDIRIEPMSLLFEISIEGEGSSPSSSSNDGLVAARTEDEEKVSIQKELRFDPASDYVSGKILVRFKSTVNPAAVKMAGGAAVTGNAAVNALLDEHGTRSVRKILRNSRNLPELNVFSITLDGKSDMKEVLEAFNAHPDVMYAEPVYRRKISAVPTDSNYYQQWAYQNIQAEDAWDIETGDPSIVIAVIDTGVDWDHPDIAANIWENGDEIPGNSTDDDLNGYVDDVRGWDTYGDGMTGDNDPMDTHGHGTHVAGIAAGVTNNTKSGTNVAGTAWNCKIMALRAGEETFEDPELFEAMEYAVDNGAQVMNLSMGGPDGSQTFRTVCDDAYNSGVLLVAAAGNEYGLITSYPAAFDSVMGVAATDSLDHVADFSNYGSWVELSAPGVGILSTVWNDDYDWWDGTSMSCPFVSGAAALVLSYDTGLTNEQARQIIVDNTDNIDSINPGYGGQIGSGRLNMYKALDAIGSAGWPRQTLTVYNDGTGTLDVTSIEKKYGKSWLHSVSPSSPEVPESSFREVTVTVNPEGLYEGFVDTEILEFHSNDADEPVVEVLVTVSVLGGGFAVTDIELRTDIDAVTITFRSVESNIYNIHYSNDPFDTSMTWSLAAAGITGQAGTTKWTDTGAMTGGPPSTVPYRYYKVEAVMGE